MVLGHQQAVYLEAITGGSADCVSDNHRSRSDKDCSITRIDTYQQGKRKVMEQHITNRIIYHSHILELHRGSVTYARSPRDHHSSMGTSSCSRSCAGASVVSGCSG
jgi:hypothetical protein